MYKQILKQTGDSWDNISRRIFGTPERAGDFEKLNSSTLGDKVIVFEPKPETEEETSGMSLSPDGERSRSRNEGVYIEIGETIYKDFSEYTLIDSLGGIKAGIFVFLCTDENVNSFRFNQAVKVYDENGVFLEGRIANVKSIRNENTTHIQIEVKSNAGILIESVVPYPLEFANQSIQQILTTIAGYYGLDIEFDEEGITEEIFTNEIGTSYSAKIDETTFQFMYRICSSRGLILHDTGTALKVFKLNAEILEKINFIEGECIGINSIRTDFIGDNLARYYEVNSQYPLTGSTVVTTPYPMPITKRLNSNDLNAKNIEEIAQRLACREIGKHFSLNIELTDNFSIKSGDIAVVKQTAVQIPAETDFVIEQAIRINPDIMSLTLTLPCVYTGILPETLPLCNV